METNMNLTVGFKGSVARNGMPVFNHDGAPITAGGIIDPTNTAVAYFGAVMSELTSALRSFVVGKPSTENVVGILQNDYSINEHSPAKPNYILGGMPASVIMFGPCWIGSFTHAATGALTVPTRTSTVIFKNDTGAIEFLAAGAAVPSGYTVLNAKVMEYVSDVNGVLLFMGVSQAETQIPVATADKKISSFAIVATGASGFTALGNIVESTGAISVTVPAGTTVTALIANFIHNGASIAVGATAQVSGVTQNNFTNPVAYVVTAADGTTKTYTVTVTVHS